MVDIFLARKTLIDCLHCEGLKVIYQMYVLLECFSKTPYLFDFSLISCKSSCSEINLEHEATHFI